MHEKSARQKVPEYPAMVQWKKFVAKRVILSYLELVNESQVRRMHEANIVNAPLQHCKAVNTETEGKALIFLGIHAHVLQNIRVYHTGTPHLHPLVAKLLRYMFADNAHVHLNTGFSKWKETRTETHFNRGSASARGGSAFGGEKFVEKSC